MGHAAHSFLWRLGAVTTRVSSQLVCIYNCMAAAAWHGITTGCAAVLQCQADATCILAVCYGSKSIVLRAAGHALTDGGSPLRQSSPRSHANIGQNALVCLQELGLARAQLRAYEVSPDDDID